jgi:hypothetical protein
MMGDGVDSGIAAAFERLVLTGESKAFLDYESCRPTWPTCVFFCSLRV